jgi:2-polyprenyl-6-methoxyphenol hydroxylase-like FAD-dependent oxidoreductase
VDGAGAIVMSARNAVVVGGGFGGMAAALALRSADISPIVLERKGSEPATSLGSGGGLTLWSNAIAALATLGLDDQIVAAGSLLTRFENRTSGGRRIATWRVDEMSDRAGWPSVNIQWEVLHRILLDALGRDVVRHATSVGLRDLGPAVEVGLTDGASVRADLAVGADGLRSSIRATLLGDVPPRYAGYDVLRAVVPYEHPDAPSGLFVQTWGPGARFGYYRVAPDRTYWFAVVNPNHRDQEAGESHRDFLERRLAGWAGPVGDLIRATPEPAISRIRIYDRDPIPRWGAGRATLLGDAAHPMTFNVGQGACQAIEDAVVLGAVLRASSDTPAALRQYEAQRQDRTSTLVLRARRIGTVARWQSPAACTVRDAAMSLILAGPAQRQHQQFITPSTNQFVPEGNSR